MTVAKIHILSLMKDIIDAKLSSMEDKIHKKAFIGRILISQKSSYKLLSTLTLIIRLAISKDFVTLLGWDNECFIIACKHTAINIDVPIFERSTYRLYFSFNALLYWRQYYPAIAIRKLALRPCLLHENAQFAKCNLSRIKRESVFLSTLQIFAIWRRGTFSSSNLRISSISWHVFSPWQSLSKLSSAHLA